MAKRKSSPKKILNKLGPLKGPATALGADRFLAGADRLAQPLVSGATSLGADRFVSGLGNISGAVASKPGLQAFAQPLGWMLTQGINQRLHGGGAGGPAVGPDGMPVDAGGGDFGFAAASTDPANSAAYMAAFNQMLNTMAGPAPAYTFDSSPYQQAIQQAQQQAQLGQGVINQGGQDLMARLGALRAQTEQRGTEDRAAIAGTQGKALAAAQGSVSPVLADLQAQGVDVRNIQQSANQRIGTMQDQAALQNTLSQRLAQNTGQVMDATGRSAVTQGAGALNNLATNLSATVNAIGQKQAAGATAANSQYLQDLAAYNKNRIGVGGDVLTMMGNMQPDGDAPDLQISAGREKLRSQIMGRQDPTAQAASTAFDALEAGTQTPEDILASLGAPAPEDYKGSKSNPTMADYLAEQGVHVDSYKKWVQDYAYPTVKEPSAKDKTKASTADIISRMFGTK